MDREELSSSSSSSSSSVSQGCRRVMKLARRQRRKQSRWVLQLWEHRGGGSEPGCFPSALKMTAFPRIGGSKSCRER
ncbi:hypothetical protein NQZ68_034941 [Dissostichus eleginoides]|nr:hypothetical protein NQZ68_034941 [Dissostichus eleginoides]